MHSKSFKNWLYTYIKLYIFLFFFFSQSLYCSVLSINDHFIKTLASHDMEFIHDINSSFKIQNSDTASWKKVVTSNLSSAKPYPTWTRFVLRNDSLQSKNIVLRNPRAGMDKIDVYILRKNMTEKILLGDQRPLSARKIPDRYSIFTLHLNPHETVTILTRLVNTIGSIEGEWVVYSEGAYHQYDTIEMLWWGIFGGMTLAMLLYAIPTLIAVKDVFLALYFTLFTLSSLMHQYSLNGLCYLSGVPIFWINRCVLFFSISFGLFIALLILRFLQIANNRGKIFWAASFFIFMMILEYILLFLGIFNDQIMQVLGLINVYFGIFAYVTWFAMMPDLLKLKLDRVFIYLFIGYTFIIAAYSIQALVAAGFLEINFISVYGVSIASLVETFCFLLGISYYIKTIQNDQKQKEKLIEFQMKFASIGKVIGNIAHQWKVPLIRSGTLLTELETTLQFDKSSIAVRLEEIIPQIRSNLHFMQDTVDEFYTLYSSQSKETNFSLTEAVKEIWSMLYAKTIKCNASIQLHEDPENIYIFSYQHMFSHVIMILLDNMLDIADQRHVKSPSMNIYIKVIKEKIEILIVDNCGGILQKPIMSIFNIDISSKNEDQSKGGMGLAMAKMIVENKLKGEIHIKNNEHGAKFTLLLPSSIC